MLDKAKIFLSDLHIGNGSEADDFTKTKEKILISVNELPRSRAARYQKQYVNTFNGVIPAVLKPESSSL